MINREDIFFNNLFYSRENTYLYETLIDFRESMFILKQFSYNSEHIVSFF